MLYIIYIIIVSFFFPLSFFHEYVYNITGYELSYVIFFSRSFLLPVKLLKCTVSGPVNPRIKALHRFPSQERNGLISLR